jgi:hypothetical protein
MICDVRRDLESSVDSAAHHLQMRLRQTEAGDPRLDLGEIKRMAQDLVNALNQLRGHEDYHHCNYA